MVDLTLSTSFVLLCFLPLFGLGASNLQCAPINNAGNDTVFDGCENDVLYILSPCVSKERRSAGATLPPSRYMRKKKNVAGCAGKDLAPSHTCRPRVLYSCKAFHFWFRIFPIFKKTPRGSE